MSGKQSKSVIVSGSLAYDLIMDFPGLFKDYILPSQIHNLSVSFYTEKLRQSDGGTAGNIAYNLSLLGVKPTILGVAGIDFLPYRSRLKSCGIDTSRIKIVPGEKTATAHIITDKADNQIAAFYPGPLPANYANQALVSLPNPGLAIISADDKSRMLGYIDAYRLKGIKYIFDPGQSVIAFSKVELDRALSGAELLIGNDYEISLMSRILGGMPVLKKLLPAIIITKGRQGSEIVTAKKKIKIRAAVSKNDIDPTGAGDAYRAGLIKGLLLGYDIEVCARLGSVAAVYAVEKRGTQSHKYTINSFKHRYFAVYQEKIKI